MAIIGDTACPSCREQGGDAIEWGVGDVACGGEVVEAFVLSSDTGDAMGLSN